MRPVATAAWLILALSVMPAAKAQDCYDAAASYHGVNGLVLRAIAWEESHNHPNARHQNDNGSTDYGLMQINSAHLAELKGFGVDETVLMQACPNVYVAAWHLRRMMDKYGNSWQAVGAYHSETAHLRDAYAARIRAILSTWKFLPTP